MSGSFSWSAFTAYRLTLSLPVQRQ
ncbi:hypothetical protein LINPERHAP1_LOCUS33486 [Linum perenne]